MKKLILLLLSIFFITGCWDYNELNNLAIVVGVGIDYEDEKFKVTYEILNDLKSDSNNESYIITGTGESYLNALENASLKVPKTLYFMHVKTLILHENLSPNHYSQVIDYNLRNPKFSNVFYTIIAKDDSAHDILSVKDDSIPVISTGIYKLLTNQKGSYNLSVDEDFDDILSKTLNYGREIALSSITIKDEKLKLEGLAVFNGLNLENYLSFDASITYNLIDNRSESLNYYHQCDNDNQTVISIYKSKSDIDVYKDKFKIKISSEATLLENNCNFDLLTTDGYNNLESEFESIITNQIKDLLNDLKEYNTDIIGFRSLYYKKYRSKIGHAWKEMNFEIDVEVSLNRKGLIYGVEKND